MDKSNGFIFAIGTHQYIEMGGALYEAPRDANLDPDGYPYGMLPHRGLSSTKDELIKEIARWGGHKMEKLNFESSPDILQEILNEENCIKKEKEEKSKRFHERFPEYKYK